MPDNQAWLEGSHYQGVCMGLSWQERWTGISSGQAPRSLNLSIRQYLNLGVVQDEEGHAQWASEVASYNFISDHSPALQRMTPRLLASGRLPPNSGLGFLDSPLEPARSSSSGTTHPSSPCSSLGPAQPERQPASASLRLSHPTGICADGSKIASSVPAEEGSKGMHFLAATRLRGRPWINDEGALPLETRVAIASQLGHALAQIHSLPCSPPSNNNLGRQQQAGDDQVSARHDAAWEPLLRQLTEKLAGLRKRLADPEGPRGLQGQIPAHIWAQLLQDLPNDAEELLFLASHSHAGTDVLSAKDPLVVAPNAGDKTLKHHECPGSPQAGPDNCHATSTAPSEQASQLLGISTREHGNSAASGQLVTPQITSQLSSLQQDHVHGVKSNVSQTDGDLSASHQQLLVEAAGESDEMCATGTQRPVWLHNDLSCFNVFLHRYVDVKAPDDHLPEVQILDFGDAAPGHPLLDFVVLHVRAFR